MNIWVFGIKYILSSKKVMLVEIVCQILAVFADYRFLTREDAYNETIRSVTMYNLVSLIRTLRLLYLLGELR